MFQFGKCLFEGVAFVETCLSGAEAVLGGEEVCECAVDLISDDFFVGDEDVLEDGLVELAPNLVTCAHVERMGVFEQFQVGFEELCSVAEVIDTMASSMRSLLRCRSMLKRRRFDAASF